MPSITGVGSRYVGPGVNAGPLPSQGQAGAMVQWLQNNGLAVADGAGRLWLSPWLTFTDNSIEARSRADMLHAACPWLAHSQALLLCTFFIERAHAERADVLAVRSGLKQQLASMLDKMLRGQPLVSARRPAGAAHLVNLRAPQYDGCLFNPAEPIDQGGQGKFFVGITPHKHPVAVKSMIHQKWRSYSECVSDFAREASATRRASASDILQLYSGPDFNYMVMPLFNGDLWTQGGAFANLRASRQDPSKQGLFGTRYILMCVLEEVRRLHEERHLVHEDIKASNLFLHKETKRLILGDLGLAASVNKSGKAYRRGFSKDMAAPEQLQNIGYVVPRTDIFNLGVTMLQMLTSQCDDVMHYRKKRHGGCPEEGLFYDHLDLTRMHEAHRQVLFEGLEGAFRDEARGAPTTHLAHHLAHFQSVHQAIDHFDKPLGQLLRRMVQYLPEDRPSAREALLHMTHKMALNDSSLQRVHDAWDHKVAEFDDLVRAEVHALSEKLETMDVRGGRARG